MCTELRSVGFYLTLVEDEIERLNNRNHDLSDINDSLKSQLNLKDREVSSLMNDLNVITRQNKNLTQEVQRYSDIGNELKV